MTKNVHLLIEYEYFQQLFFLKSTDNKRTVLILSVHSDWTLRWAVKRFCEIRITLLLCLLIDIILKFVSPYKTNRISCNFFDCGLGDIFDPQRTINLCIKENLFVNTYRDIFSATSEFEKLIHYWSRPNRVIFCEKAIPLISLGSGECFVATFLLVFGPWEHVVPSVDIITRMAEGATYWANAQRQYHNCPDSDPPLPMTQIPWAMQLNIQLTELNEMRPKPKTVQPITA